MPERTLEQEIELNTILKARAEQNGKKTTPELLERIAQSDKRLLALKPPTPPVKDPPVETPPTGEMLTEPTEPVNPIDANR